MRWRAVGRVTYPFAAAVVLAAQAVVAAPMANSAATTFTNDTPVTITDGPADPFPSTVVVSGLTQAVYDVDLTLHGLSHSWPSDLEIVLEAPSGLAATVISDLGDDTDLADATLIFDDDAPGRAPVPLASGRYLPEDIDPDPADGDIEPPAEDSFDDLVTSPYLNGTWSLYIADDGTGDTGMLASWSLTFHEVEQPRIVSPANGASLRGPTVAVRGTGTPDTQVTVRLTGQADRTVTVAGDGTWAVDFSGVAYGQHTLHAWPTRLSPVGGAGVLITVDNGPPTGSLTLRTVRGTAERTSSRRVYLHVEASEPIKGVRVSNDGETFGELVTTKLYDGYPWLLADVDGTRRVLVQLEDMAGNVSTGYVSDTVVLDRSAPRVNRTWPRHKARDVARSTVVRARFDDFVTPNAGTNLSYLAQLFRVGSTKRVPAVVRFDAATATVRILPTKPLRRDTLYKGRVAGFLDDAGNYLDQKPATKGSQAMVWRFRTR